MKRTILAAVVLMTITSAHAGVGYVTSYKDTYNAALEDATSDFYKYACKGDSSAAYNIHTEVKKVVSGYRAKISYRCTNTASGY